MPRHWLFGALYILLLSPILTACGDKHSDRNADDSGGTGETSESEDIEVEELTRIGDSENIGRLTYSVVDDLSGDGLDDLVIGVPGSADDADGATQGTLMIYLGSGALTTGGTTVQSDYKLFGREAGVDHYGLGVKVGTVAAADFSDRWLVVGLYVLTGSDGDEGDYWPVVELVDVGAIVAGENYVDSVRATMSHGKTPVWEGDFENDTKQTMFGDGDLNGDGVQDLALSMAIGIDPDDTARLSGACVYFGPISGETYYEDANFVLWDNNDYDENRLSEGVIQMGGDFNGDGYDDLLTGATINSHTPDWDNISITFGSSVEGGELFDPDILLKPKRLLPDDAEAMNVGDRPFFGSTAGYIGDWDGDGHEDIAVGANDAGTYDGSEGVVYIFGNLDPGFYDESAASTAILGEPYDNLGEAVTTVGDLWGDLSADILVGGLGDSTRGAALFSGGSGNLGIDDAKVVVSTGVYGDFDTPEGAESMVSGDLDGDGLLDTVIGGRSGAHFILPGALLAE